MCAPRNVFRRVKKKPRYQSRNRNSVGLCWKGNIRYWWYSAWRMRSWSQEQSRAAHPPAVRSVHLSRSSEFGESDTKQQGQSKPRPLHAKKGTTHHIRVWRPYLGAGPNRRAARYWLVLVELSNWTAAAFCSSVNTITMRKITGELMLK